MRDIDLKPLTEAENPAVLCSFGMDSLVLLRAVLDTRPDTTIIHFYDHLTPFVNKIICDWDLSVASYAPACRYRVEDTVVSEYAIGDARLPLLQDISVDGRPSGTVTTPRFNYDFDLTLFGYRKTDTHPLVETVFPQSFQLGPTTMYAPLYEYSDDDVHEAINELGISYETHCDDALGEGLPYVSREVFQQRFSLKEH